METMKNILGAIDQAVETAKGELDQKYSSVSLEADCEALKARVGATAAKLKEDLLTLADELPNDVLALYERGVRVWHTPTILPQVDQPRLVWAGHDLFYNGGIGSFALPSGLWKILVVAMPVKPSDVSEEEKKELMCHGEARDLFKSK